MVRNKFLELYSAWTNDNLIMNSSSGGIFPVIASEVLEEGGVVFGAGFDNNLKLKHFFIKNKKDLYKLQGSKYIQSYIGKSFVLVKKFLKKDREVLFVGTPCQVAGLRKFLKKDYNNLICIDFVCHGVPSKELFDRYKNYLEERYNSKVIGIKFRDKKNGWVRGISPRVYFKNGLKLRVKGKDNWFMKAFSRNYSINKECHNCLFRKIERQGDITLGDFWEVASKYPKQAKKGVSFLLVNSKKGKEILDLIKRNLDLNKEDLERYKDKLNKVKRYKDTELFLKDIKEKGIDFVYNKYLKDSYVRRGLDFFKQFIPLRFILFSRKIRGLRGKDN